MKKQGSKHAYLIMAHHQFEILEMLLKLLDHEQHDFYIHIDRSAGEFDFERFKNVPKKSKIHFTKRLSVKWGGHSQIRCEQLLLDEAVKGNYSFYHLLSGVDLPLKPADTIYRFFEENLGSEFLYFSSDEFAATKEIRERVSIFHFFKNFYGRNNRFFEICDHILVRVQRALHIDRMKKGGYVVRCGANWFSISHDFAEFVCSQKKQIRRYFYHSHCADEVFLHTIVYHKYGKDFPLYRKELGSDYLTSARLIDWNRGQPYTFRSSDFDELMASEAMFARKFDYGTDPEICHRIFDALTDSAITDEVFSLNEKR